MSLAKQAASLIIVCSPLAMAGCVRQHPAATSHLVTAASRPFGNTAGSAGHRGNGGTDPRPGNFHLRVGDLLFQDLDCGPMCDAIEAVTHGVRGAHLSHVAIVVAVWGQKVSVLEAYAHGVAVTSLDEFLSRSHDRCGRPKVLVGRLDDSVVSLVPAAIDYGLKRLGMPYDEHFTMNNGAFYCSELIYEMFLHANAGRPLFHLAPMSFTSADGSIAPVWKQHFERLHEPVPQGEPGINPGAMSRNLHVHIVHAFGSPQGWTAAPSLISCSTSP